jgi:hypothetical protein
MLFVALTSYIIDSYAYSSLSVEELWPRMEHGADSVENVSIFVPEFSLIVQHMCLIILDSKSYG